MYLCCMYVLVAHQGLGNRSTNFNAYDYKAVLILAWVLVLLITSR